LRRLRILQSDAIGFYQLRTSPSNFAMQRGVVAEL